jgi:hypothetical protein
LFTVKLNSFFILYLESKDDIDLGLYLFHISAFGNVGVEIVEDSKTAVDEQSVHDVHKCEERIFPKF